MRIEGKPYNPILDRKTLAMKSNPFIVTKILKNSVWTKELQIEEGDIIFFDTRNLFNTLVQLQHLTVVNLSKNRQAKNSIQIMDRIYPRKDKQDNLTSDVMEYDMISWDDYEDLIRDTTEDKTMNL